MLGKTFDTFAPIGPAIVTNDEAGDVHNLGMLNAAVMNDGFLLSVISLLNLFEN